MSYNYNKKGNGKNDTGRPKKFLSPMELEKQGMEYIDDCRTSKKPITITGLCLWLKTTRDTLMEYQREKEFSDTIKRLKLHAENYAEEYLYNPNGRAVVGAIFALKNFGWKDTHVIESNIIQGALTAEERAEAQERIRNFSE
ncbi:MAG: hypothetical protein KBC19_03410 [Candidatus Moranbacteria bacterium]|jgi:hypothetical protein|nr:hypothetical protein [Candidatus Moranbacteria bacterium]